MSYILDALKKSEFERQQSRVPDLNTMPVMIGSGRNESLVPRLSYGLGALALAGVIAGVAWWRPWQSSPPEAAVAAGTAAAPAAPVLAPAPLPRPEEIRAARSAQVSGTGAAPEQPAAAKVQTPFQPAAPSPAAPAAPKIAAVRPTAPETVPPVRDSGAPKSARVAPATTGADEPPAALKAPAARKPAEPVARTRPAPAPPQPQHAEADAPAPDVAAPAAAPATEKPPKRVLSYAELPASVQKSIPKMTVMGYSYAEEPEMRMVVINDRMLREGDEVSPGVKLEKIGSDGVVLNFRGFQFRPQP